MVVLLILSTLRWDSRKQRPAKTHDVLTTIVRFDSVARPIIDGRKGGFCKLVTDRKTYRILGCHVVGERAVDITQLAAIAISASMKVNDFLRILFHSRPTEARSFALRLLRHGNSICRLGSIRRFEAHRVSLCISGKARPELADFRAEDLYCQNPAGNCPKSPSPVSWLAQPCRTTEVAG